MKKFLSKVSDMVPVVIMVSVAALLVAGVVNDFVINPSEPCTSEYFYGCVNK